MDAIEIARASRVYGAVLCGVGGILVLGGGVTVAAVGVGASTIGWGLVLVHIGARGGSAPAWSLVERTLESLYRDDRLEAERAVAEMDPREPRSAAYVAWLRALLALYRGDFEETIRHALRSAQLLGAPSNMDDARLLVELASLRALAHAARDEGDALAAAIAEVTSGADDTIASARSDLARAVAASRRDRTQLAERVIALAEQRRWLPPLEQALLEELRRQVRQRGAYRNPAEPGSEATTLASTSALWIERMLRNGAVIAPPGSITSVAAPEPGALARLRNDLLAVRGTPVAALSIITVVFAIVLALMGHGPTFFAAPVIFFCFALVVFPVALFGASPPTRLRPPPAAPFHGIRTRALSNVTEGATGPAGALEKLAAALGHEDRGEVARAFALADEVVWSLGASTDNRVLVANLHLLRARLLAMIGNRHEASTELARVEASLPGIDLRRPRWEVGLRAALAEEDYASALEAFDHAPRAIALLPREALLRDLLRARSSQIAPPSVPPMLVGWLDSVAPRLRRARERGSHPAPG